MAAAPPVTAILETALYVDDMARACRFYEDVLGLEALLSDERLTAFRAGPENVLLLFRRGATREDVHMAGGTIPAHHGEGPLHFAFAVPEDALPRWKAHLEAHGIPIRSEVAWPQGGKSLYVDDPDGHVVEFATPGIWPKGRRG